MRIIIFLSLLILPLTASYGYTTTITAVPAGESGFYYSDGQGNSISSTRMQAVPVLTETYPNAVWVYMTGGNVPPNAVIVQYVNGNPTYYCKVASGGEVYYGQLFPGEGCQLFNRDERPYDHYQVLMR